MRFVTTFCVLGLLGAASAVAIAQPQTPAPGPTPAPVAPVASATPTPLYKFVYKATPSPNSTPFPGPGAPEIDEIDLNDSTLVPPADIHARVLTNPAVVSVVAETMGATLDFPRTAPGVFLLDAHINAVPTFLRNRGFDVSFTATVADGRLTTVTLPLTIK